MDSAEPSEEYAGFVSGLVPLGDVQGAESGGDFAGLMGRLTSLGSGGPLPGSILSGGLLLLGSGAAALMPDAAAIESSHFWRVARSAAAQLVTLGHGATLPMLAGGLLLLVVGLILGYHGRGDESTTTALSLVGAAGLGLILVFWLGLGALWLLNLAVLVVTIAAYVVGAILALGIFFGMLGGLAN